MLQSQEQLMKNQILMKAVSPQKQYHNDLSPLKQAIFNQFNWKRQLELQKQKKLSEVESLKLKYSQMQQLSIRRQEIKDYREGRSVQIHPVKLLYERFFYSYQRKDMKYFEGIQTLSIKLLSKIMSTYLCEKYSQGHELTVIKN